MSDNWKKISDDLFEPDVSATALVPVDVHRNLTAQVGTTQVQCSHAYVGTTRANGNYMQVATPPDAWWGIPYVIRRYPGMDRIKLNLVYRTVGGNEKVSAKLHCLGVDGSTVELQSVGASAAASLTVDVTIGDSNAPLVVWLMLQSQMAASPTGTITVSSDPMTDGADGRTFVECATSIGPSADTVPYAFLDEGGERYWFVGAWDTGATPDRAYLWPRRPVAASAQSMYELTRLELRSVNLGATFSGTNPLPGTFPLPRVQTYHVAKVARAQHLEQLYAAAWKLWYDRRHVSQIAPRDHGDGFSLGARRDRTLVSAMRRVRTGTTGSEVTILAVGEGRSDAAFVCEHVDVSQTTVGSTYTRSMPVQSYTSTREADGEGVLREIPYHWIRAGESWAGADLVPESQRDRLQLFTFRVQWPAGAVVGDHYGLRITLDVAKALWHVHGAGVVDALPRGRRQPPGMPWL